MLKITIPNNNIQERQYILDVVFNEFLELDFQLIKDENCKNWKIELENRSEIIFEDHFFSKYPRDLEYLRLANIPSCVKYTKNEFIVEKDIPIIYGNSTFSIKNSTIIVGIDIFASSFFMLTRWEEHVTKNRDKHGRFSAYESLAFKNRFLDRPIVNEYIEMLKNIIFSMDKNSKFKIQNSKLYLTHDIDIPFRYMSIKNNIREVIGDIVIRKSFKIAMDSIKRQVKVFLKMEKDPFDTYDFLMDTSENLGVKSYFFLHSSNLSKYDYSNDKYIKQIANKIKKRGHLIGYHPSYNSSSNDKIFKKDKEKIEFIIGEKIEFSRQHYLRFEIPTTWQMCENHGMKWESTLGYAEREGFRAGVCYAYSVFNILTRSKLHLKERPLIVMDTSFPSYQEEVTPQEIQKSIIDLIKKIKKYNGDFVFLWHNSSFNMSYWLKYQEIYRKILVYAN